jgi:site-specific recombinase XerC
VKHTASCVTFFYDFLGYPPDPATITADDLRRFIVALQDAPRLPRDSRHTRRRLSSVTINTYIRAIKGCWSCLVTAGFLPTNPLAGVSAPRFTHRIPVVYTESQLKAVLHQVKHRPRERAIIEFFLDSGVRLSELCNLQLNDVDLTTGRIKVCGKGNKERYTYVSPATLLSLHHYLPWRDSTVPKSDNLFLSYDGYPLQPKRVQDILKTIGWRAGLPVRLAPHKLRHTYATLCLKNGNNLEYVRLTLGHTDIKTTSQAYLAAAEVDIAGAARRASPLANLGRYSR